MSPCTDSRVISYYERIANYFMCQMPVANLGPRVWTQHFVTHYCPRVWQTITHPSKAYWHWPYGITLSDSYYQNFGPDKKNFSAFLCWISYVWLWVFWQTMFNMEMINMSRPQIAVKNLTTSLTVSEWGVYYFNYVIIEMRNTNIRSTSLFVLNICKAHKLRQSKSGREHTGSITYLVQ